MANRIMGITVKIGKDTTKLQTGFLYNSKCRKNKKLYFINVSEKVCRMILKVAIKCYCEKNKGGIIYEKNSIKRSMPITCIMFTLLLSIIIYRPFCKYICPLGAIYSIFNPISIFRYRLDKDKCINCGKCKKVCQMNIDPVENCNHLECIRCGRCKNACPVDAISYGVRK